jgi:glycosyl-4,4'-diaponeurosporenoate acyltransferase
MKTQDAHPLGIAWVTLVFVSLPAVLLFFDYGVRSVWLRVPLMAGISGIATFSVIAVLFWVSRLRRIQFGAAWYRPRDSESVELYRMLGVKSFRNWLLESPFSSLGQDVHLRGSSSEDLTELKNHMDSAEANHAIAFALTVPLTALYSAGNSLEFLPWFLLLNVVGNVYPILLQRMNRLRVAGVLERRHRTAG